MDVAGTRSRYFRPGAGTGVGGVGTQRPVIILSGEGAPTASRGGEGHGAAGPVGPPLIPWSTPSAPPRVRGGKRGRAEDAAGDAGNGMSRGADASGEEAARPLGWVAASPPPEVPLGRGAGGGYVRGDLGWAVN
jgi:hypothetical protein